MNADLRSRFRFFLGGHDLEMFTIRELLRTHCPPDAIADRSLSWGARTSLYAEEIAAAIRSGQTPVLVELTVDILVPESAIIIDHHNERAGRGQPTSLEQVFKLLGLPESMWTRQMLLVAANDRGHIVAMQEAGATPSEIRSIRAEDRRAQGVTLEQERQALIAVQTATKVADGNLTVVRLPHSRTSAAADAMEISLGGPGYQNLLICTPDSANFFGAGRLIDALRSTFPDGWYGGELPVRGFWGRNSTCDAVLETLIKAITSST